MYCIYHVRYEFCWHGKTPDHWEPASVSVLAGPDAQEAVDKARALAMRMNQINDSGVEERCIGFRLREVKIIAEATL